MHVQAIIVDPGKSATCIDQSCLLQGSSLKLLRTASPACTLALPDLPLQVDGIVYAQH